MVASISSNADQFRESFREEAREILVELESALLELNGNRADPELLGRIFRGLHTIKGSGAMFGFENLAAFTHHLETVFDEVRNGRLEVGSELIDLTLSALDQIHAMLEGAGGPESAKPESADSRARTEILRKVRQIAGLAESAPVTAKVTPASASVMAPAGPERRWRIHFAPGPDLMQCGANPLLLVRELRQLGELSVCASMAAVPPLGELDPERCYVSWDLVLSTAASRDAIRDIFIFVEDSCELVVEPDEENGSEAKPAEPVCEADVTARALQEKRSGFPGGRSYDAPDNASSLRVPAAKLDQFVDLVGELVTVQARLSELSARRDDTEVAQVSEEVERLTSALRESAMNIRMMPIRATFEKFRRLVHDLARDLGKNVELTIEGADTELDKTVIDQLSDPLMHLIRNSMDHGIEPPERRVANGKPPTANIRLTARHSGASVLVAVADDGGGIDAEAVRQRAIERGLVSPDAPLTEAETFALLFQPGFSTAKQVTDISGRGVGMDVVRQKVESLRGAIEVASKPGRGTSVTLRLPLTMAIIDGLLVGVGEACFVLPLATTLECVELTHDDIARANGKHLTHVRGELVPYVSLRQHFDIPTEPPAIQQVMLVETAEGRFGFVVDRVLGNCQTVIKSLGRFYREVHAVSGATILGNGAVALILDPDRLVHDAIHCERPIAKGRPSPVARVRANGRAQVSAPQGAVGAGPGASASQIGQLTNEVSCSTRHESLAWQTRLAG